MNGLEGFSDWTLSLLPRLFLYPGGAWMLAALLWLRLASGGMADVRPSALVRELARASLLALAVAWVALSLVPLPGASPLAAPINRFVLIALIIASLALDEVKKGASGRREGWVSMGIALALLAPVVQDRALLGYVPAWGVSSVLSMACVGWGLVSLSPDTTRHLSGGVRWLAWLGLGFAPLLGGWAQSPVGGIYWVSLMYALLIALLPGVGRFFAGYMNGRDGIAVAAVWLLAILALLAGLLGY